MRVDFYHLAATPLERVLPSVCERVLAAGGRLVVVTTPERVDSLDEQLWTQRPESFLPHAAAGSPRDAAQPILISSEVAPANGARSIALADGRWRDEALGFDRTFYFFDSATIEDARASWRALKDRPGIDRHYWKQDERGGWVEGP